MKKYLSTIRERSTAHKKGFALIVSGGFTIFIFSIWSLTTFSNANVVVAKAPSTDNVPTAVSNNDVVSPFENLSGGVANSIDAIKQQFNKIKQSVGSVNIQNQYQDARDQALTN